MPAGPAIGVVWDTSDNTIVALSRLIQVPPRGIALAALEPALESGSVYAEIAARDLALDVSPELALERAGVRMAPAFVNLSADKIVAAWYGVEPGDVVFKARAGSLASAPVPLRIQKGRIEFVGAALETLPGIDVQLALPPSLGHLEHSIFVRRLRDSTVLASRLTDPSRDRYRFEALPREELEVVLATERYGTHFQVVDLSNGRDGLAVLDPQLVVVHGTVRLGEDSVAAHLEFESGRDPLPAVETDAEGRYEVATLLPIRGVLVGIPTSSRPPYLHLFRPEIDKSRELELRVPRGEFSVRVVDAATRRGIPEAVVNVRNEYLPTDSADIVDEQARQSAMVVSAHAHTTDSNGEAELAPLHGGSLELRAQAKGYEPQSRPLKRAVVDPDGSAVFEIALTPAETGPRLRLLLASGEPAAHARVRLVAHGSSAAASFDGQADADGNVSLPRGGGILLVRHPSAGALASTWPIGSLEAGDEAQVVQLPRPARRPLVVKGVLGRDVAVAWADVTLWLFGLRLSGTPLAWLTGTSAGTNAAGFWSAANIPEVPVSILLSAAQGRAETATGLLDGQAKQLPYPWPPVVEFEVVR